MATLTILGPGTPMLFQGQEFGSTAPFLFFADMPDSLLQLVRDGRKEFMKQWRSVQTQSMLDCLADPCARETFERCKLDFSEREKNREIYQLHRDLIRLKRTDPVLRQAGSGDVDGAVLSSSAFLLRFFGVDGDDRLLLVNLGTDLYLNPAPEPLLAPVWQKSWRTLICTESPEYGGLGCADLDAEELNWILPGHAAALLGPGPLLPAVTIPKEKSAK